MTTHLKDNHQPRVGDPLLRLFILQQVRSPILIEDFNVNIIINSSMTVLLVRPALRMEIVRKRILMFLVPEERTNDLSNPALYRQAIGLTARQIQSNNPFHFFPPPTILRFNLMSAHMCRSPQCREGCKLYALR